LIGERREREHVAATRQAHLRRRDIVAVMAAKSRQELATRILAHLKSLTLSGSALG
jgi:hypothetical protein